jgi:RNA polymerase sigma factor (TIGR02999 family)
MRKVSQSLLAHQVRRNFAANWLSQFDFFGAHFWNRTRSAVERVILGFQIEELMTSPATITQMLIRWRNGDKAALDELAPLVYSELRRLARYYLRAERSGHTLQPSDLVHEAYLRLVDEKEIDWQNRAHFFGVAAVRMRHILVERARSRRAAKRGGGEYRLTLSEADRLTDKRDVNLLALDDALRRLEALDPQKSRIVELRYFGGLTIEETAEAMKISPATVKRDWSMARAWLRSEISNE